MPTRIRDQRGVVLPSPVVGLSVIAVAMAGLAFVATRSQEPTEREVAVVSRQEPSPSSSPSELTRKAEPKPKTKTKTKTKAEPKPKPKPKPAVERGKVYVEVYNNSGITGLAGQVSARASDAGWPVVGSDNWYGTIPTSTVYHPERLEAAAKLLALDLGVGRTALAIDPMRLDRLTVILTADAQ